MTEEQHRWALHNIVGIIGPSGADAATSDLEPAPGVWTEAELDARLATFFLEGPTNVHQITLADALLWVWNHHPEHRQLCAANVLCFTRGASPKP